MRVPRLVLVGGFLGAGKTTLILTAARMLRDRGMRVAVITNDQDDGLVDTRLAEARGVETREVAGGCFCCRFSEMIEAADQLKAFAPDVIFAEPVGSCVDLSATIVHPLAAYYGDQYRTAPLTVLVDPARAALAKVDEDVRFLFEKQIAEADILCVTKADQGGTVALPFDYRVSAVTGEGVAEWLNDVLEGSRIAGAQVLDVDYGRYAEAEAALGWVNIQVELRLGTALSPAMVVGPLLERIEEMLTHAGIGIAHLKAFDCSECGFVKASLCGNSEESTAEGDLMASASTRHELAVNLRALGEPEQLRTMVFQGLDGLAGERRVLHEGAFRPSPPVPEHRLTADR